MANLNESMIEGKSTFKLKVLSLELLHGLNEWRNMSNMRDNLRIDAIRRENGDNGEDRQKKNYPLNL